MSKVPIGRPGQEESGLRVISWGACEALLSAQPFIDWKAFEEADPTAATMTQAILRWLVQEGSILTIPRLLKRAHSFPQPASDEVVLRFYELGEEPPKRPAAVTLEAVVCGSLVAVLLVLIVQLAWVVFCNNTVASLAREATRAASVHGSEWSRFSGNAPWDQAEVTRFVQDRATLLDKSRLTVIATWPNGTEPYSVAVGINGDLVPTANVVRVRVDYAFPGLTLSSTSESVISY